MTSTQIRKQTIRGFIRQQYTDERLAQILAHAQDGKLNYSSCCCLIGIVTADHALESRDRCETLNYNTGDHFDKAYAIPNSREAEQAFRDIAPQTPEQPYDRNALRRRIVIPMVRAEMKRRSKLAEVSVETESTICVSA